MGSQQLGDSNEDTVRCGRVEGILFKRMYLRYILLGKASLQEKYRSYPKDHLAGFQQLYHRGENERWLTFVQQIYVQTYVLKAG